MQQYGTENLSAYLRKMALDGYVVKLELPELKELVGPNGKVWGLESFGFSAPYKVLDEKLGFTAKNVYNQVKELLA